MSTGETPGEDGASIANELIGARTARGMTQAQLSELSGVSRSAIKAYESGRNMPGSRELRAICKALNVTPNRLLFGTESPVFGEGGAAELEAALRGDPENQAVLRMRLAVLASLLTGEEAGALMALCKSLALARHGPEKVAMELGRADFLTGMGREMMQQGLSAHRTGAPIDPDAFASNLEAMLERQGHKPVK